MSKDNSISSCAEKAWESFLAGEEGSDAAVRRLIEDSWQRCLKQGVDPIQSKAHIAVKDNDLEGYQYNHLELLNAAKPIMKQARDFLSESGTVMVLTDPKGVILCVEGDGSTKDKGNAIRLIPGGSWNESAIGTNAIGTALASCQPVQIFSSEHFCETIKQWTCSASVIRDPFGGEVVGVLDVSGLSGDHNAHCLALAITGAGRIESRLAALEMEKRSRLLEVTFGKASRWHNNGLVIFDKRGRLVRANETASEFLSGIGLTIKDCGRLDLNETKTPHWYKDDWLEPIMDHNELLGTVMAIPVKNNYSRVDLVSKNVQSHAPVPGFDEIIGGSQVMMRVKNRAHQLSQLNVPVLLLGPTGAGKEVFANAIHKSSKNNKGPFVPLNCGGMTRDLLASELFGYVEGAFTGASRGGMIGKFEAANGGTLFLDEIGEMPIELQPHFLRVLEDGVVYRVGENKPRKVSVRLIAATNRDLRAEVEAGKFRMDLYYRLAVTLLHLPGLKDHQDDIPLLVNFFIQKAAKVYEITAKPVSNEVIEVFKSYSWPGNIRELKNVVESMLLLSLGECLTLSDLPPDFMGGGAYEIMSTDKLSAQNQFLSVSSLEDSEKATIILAIQAENGNFTKAAQRLKIAKSTLYEKMKRYEITRSSIGV